MTLNDSKYYLSYLNKLVEEYNNIYHRPVSKKPIDVDYSALNDENESSHKVSKFQVDDRVRITKYKDIFSKDYTKKWSRVIFVIDFVLKTNQWFKRRKMTGSFYEKELLLTKLKNVLSRTRKPY